MKNQWKGIQEREAKRRKVDKKTTEGSSEEILAFEVRDLLANAQASRHLASVNGKDSNDAVESGKTRARSEPFQEMEVDIVELSSTGDGLAVSPTADRVYVVPFTLPGDRVRVRLVNSKHRLWTICDFVELISPSPQRDDSHIKCQYFGTCSGCQLQMLPYEGQLAHKKRIVEKAYRNFSGLDANQVPPIGDTMPSPLQYAYRTKLTPHFDGPRRGISFREPPNIGFAKKGFRHVLDIENCPLGTEIVQEGFKLERARIHRTFSSFKKGVTLLMRESTQRIPNNSPSSSVPETEPLSSELATTPSTSQRSTTNTGQPLLTTHQTKYREEKTCITDNNATSTEFIDNWTFTSRAGSFFQNNNSILSSFTAYVRAHALPTTPSPSSPPIKYLLDAYCGSGLFTITLSSLFTSSLGIDVDSESIDSARANVSANAIPNAGFIQADASAIFADVPFPAEQTLVVMDPPRKGASLDFLNQLLVYGAKRVVYVSCNVHTQARDVGMLVRGGEKGGKWKYRIEKITGADFFPQTGHVEGVAFLDRVDARAEEVEGTETVAGAV